MPTTTEARHPIGVVAERTGLTPDVLRVWERRYGVVEPQRSPGGQRIYSDADIERLALLHRATQGGHGISHVASLSKSKLEELVKGIEAAASQSPTRFIPAGEPHFGVAQAIAFTEALDPAGLESLLRRSVARYGIVGFIDMIAAPFLRQVGDGWHEGTITVAQEHMATAVVQRVVNETAPLLTGGHGNPVIVIATLEGERHAIGALMAAATAASEGWRVIYLGADLPLAEIADAAKRTGALAVGLSAVIYEKKRATALKLLERALGDDIVLVVGGSAAASFAETIGRSDIVFVENMSALLSRLSALRTS